MSNLAALNPDNPAPSRESALTGLHLSLGSDGLSYRQTGAGHPWRTLRRPTAYPHRLHRYHACAGTKPVHIDIITARGMKRIALLGCPSTGIHLLQTHQRARRHGVGNWPGVTVDLMGAKVVMNGATVELVDVCRYL